MKYSSGVVAVVLLLAPVPAQAQVATAVPRAGTAFRFAPVNDVALGLWEGDRPVLAYNHGVLLKKGVPANFARSSYVHPIYGLAGEVITDDFPADHFHHRGLFWGWPHVKVGGKEYDNWALRGIDTKFERWLAREAGPTGAVLGVQNGWYVGKRRVLDEQVWFRVHPASNGRRAIDVELWLKPLEPVTLSGAEGKSYGGMTLRFAPGDDTQITVPSGRTGDDLYINRQPWTDLTRKWPGRTEASGAALFVAKDHPDYPPTWLTRHYGVLCLGWPGVTPKTLPPGQAVRLSYRVWIHNGTPDAAQLGKEYADYLARPPKAIRPE